MEQTEVSISEKEKAARLIKEMREQGLLRDGSFGKLALPTTEEADTMTRRPSWFAPDAVVLAPPSSICPHFGVLAVNSFVIPEDEESQRRVSLESGMETDRRAHFTESVTSEEEVQGPPPPLEQAKPAQRDLEWDSSEDDKRMEWGGWEDGTQCERGGTRGEKVHSNGSVQGRKRKLLCGHLTGRGGAGRDRGGSRVADRRVEGAQGACRLAPKGPRLLPRSRRSRACGCVQGLRPWSAARVEGVG
eukprot:3933293-Rhodomonas_salina.1